MQKSADGVDLHGGVDRADPRPTGRTCTRASTVRNFFTVWLEMSADRPSSLYSCFFNSASGTSRYLACKCKNFQTQKDGTASRFSTTSSTDSSSGQWCCSCITRVTVDGLFSFFSVLNGDVRHLNADVIQIEPLEQMSADRPQYQHGRAASRSRPTGRTCMRASTVPDSSCRLVTANLSKP